MKKIAACITLLSIMVMSMTGCATFDSFKATFISKTGEKEETVRIGVFEPMSGEDKEKGLLEVQGIELAHEMFPTALGKSVELFYGDNSSDINIAEAVARDFVEQRVSVVLGSYGSANSLVAVKIFEEAKLPAIAITNTNPLVTSYNPFYFRVCLLDSFQGVGMAKYAVESLKATKAGILIPKRDDYATAVSQTFSDKFIQMTGDSNSVVLTCEYNKDSEDFEKPLKELKESGAEVIFLPEKPEVAKKVLKQAKKLGMTGIFLGTDQWETEDFLLSMTKNNIKNLAYSTVFDPNTDTTVMSETFLKAYREKYGEDAVPDSAVALGFDAYMIAVDSINKAGTALDGEKIRQSIASTIVFPGASGTITLDSNGDPIKTVVVKTITAGKATAIYTMEPEIVNLYELSLQQ